MYLHSRREERSLKVQLPQTARMLWKASLTKISAYNEARRTRIAPAKCIAVAVQDNNPAYSKSPPADNHGLHDYEDASLATTPSLTLSNYSEGADSIYSMTSSLSSSLSLANNNFAAPGRPVKSVTTMQIRKWLRKPLRKLHQGMIHVNTAFLLRTSVSSPVMSSPAHTRRTCLPQLASASEADIPASPSICTAIDNDEDGNDLGEQSISNGRSAFDATYHPPPSKHNHETRIASARYGQALHCKILHVNNLASSRGQEFDLDIRLNGISQTTLVRGTLCKSSKGQSGCPGPEKTFVLCVEQTSIDEQPFELAFVMARRRGQKIFWRRTKNSTQESIIVGVARIASQHLPNAHHQVVRYRLANPNNVKNWDIELTVELTWEEDNARSTLLPPAVGTHGNDSPPSDPHSDRQPWTYYTYTSGLSRLDDETLSNDDVLCDETTLRSSREHCTAGDYLTFYMHGAGFPTWQRFWVTLSDDSKLVLHSFSHKGKQPMELPLSALERVSKPTLDDQEAVCISRAHGLILLVATDTERHKIVAYADHTQHAVHWRRVLNSIIKENTCVPADPRSIDPRLFQEAYAI
ncbi:hypothetical protein BCR43DRAFT_514194 [Syncephalastrum racemosum]|uniref:PH domain-containing protein n=1 Tax=Syncephalastrum racemosum TaxID=13706 RepID=A0A1X2HFX7_SYNRA|nr:hypothetical protein BCR43DRAFT_514194 [Syncephalastrum racemosum]